MKRLIIGLSVFVFLLVGVYQTEASLFSDLVNEINSLRSKMTASVLDSSGLTGTPTSDVTPRIMYWSGKVNQHVNLENKQWETDPDGKSGAGINKLTYCKKWYPNTVSVKDGTNETISTWRASGNTGSYSSTKLTTLCIQSGITPVDGGWSAWTNSGSCVNGYKNQTRTCTNPAPVNGGANCVGSSTQTIKCVASPFDPVDGGWSAWTNSGSCVNGYQTQTRTCTNPAPVNGGANCVGSPTQIIKCDLSPSIPETLPNSSTSSITITYPNGGEDYKTDQQIAIRWETKDIPTSAIMNVSVSNGTNIGPSIKATNDGRELYTLSSQYFKPGTNYQAIVKLDSNNLVVAKSGSFDILDGSIISTSCLDPDSKSGGFYSKGKTTTVENGVTKYYYDSSINSRTIKEYYCDGNNIASVDFTCNSLYDSYDGACVRNNYRENETDPAFLITYPNTELSFIEGEKIKVTWTYKNISPNEDVSLMLRVHSKDGTAQQSYNLISVTPNDGEEEIVLPTIATLREKGITYADYGKNYQVYINRRTKGSSDSGDTSDVYFSIISTISDVSLYKGKNESCLTGATYDPVTNKACPKPACIDGLDNDSDGKMNSLDNNCHVGLTLSGAYISSYNSESMDGLKDVKTLKFGMNGGEVMALQDYIDIPSGKIDGIFGNETLSAVKAWQTKMGLEADGIFGPACYTVMLMEYFLLSNPL